MNTKTFTRLSVLMGIMVFFTACKGTDKKEDAILSEKLNVYNWTYIIPEDVLEDFESEFGVNIIYDNYYSNEELLAKIQNPSHGYDVIFPSDYMTEIMIKKGMLAKLDYGQIPNEEYLDTKFKGEFFDPSDDYSVPFQWSTAGLGINTENVELTENSWNVLFNEKYKNRISMLDDIRYGIAPALIKLGYSPNTKNPSELGEAEELMKKQKELVKLYNSDTYMDLLNSGEVDIAYGYSIDFLQLERENPNIKYIIPIEGTTKAIESMAIPKESKRKYTAEIFINYILRPKVHARITQYSLAGNPNKGAHKFINKNILDNENIFPSDSTNAKLVFLRDVGDLTPIYDKTWNEIKNH